MAHCVPCVGGIPHHAAVFYGIMMVRYHGMWYGNFSKQVLATDGRAGVLCRWNGKYSTGGVPALLVRTHPGIMVIFDTSRHHGHDGQSSNHRVFFLTIYREILFCVGRGK